MGNFLADLTLSKLMAFVNFFLEQFPDFTADDVLSNVDHYTYLCGGRVKNVAQFKTDECFT